METTTQLTCIILFLVHTSTLADRRNNNGKIGTNEVKTLRDMAKTSGSYKDPKLFSLFSIVTFPNDQCTTLSDTTMIGTCFTATECTSKSGKVDGNCAAGFGVCCTFTVSTCGSSVNQNCSYITNPSYPTTFATTGACAYSVTPVSSDICQLRLDFDNFDITDVTATGACTDSFVVTTPTGRKPNDLCGTLTNAHIYLENGRSTTATTLSFTIATGGTWKIKVTHIECSSVMKAPSDCLQWYFSGPAGEVKSFNFGGGVQLQNHAYTLCVRREQGYCGIMWRPQSGTTPDSFDLSDAALMNVNGGTDATGQAMAYIAIPGSPVDFYSGTVLSSQFGTADTINSGTVLATGVPFQIQVHNLVQTQLAADGFDLVYSQAPCALAVE